jgi:hypothetical protein
MRNHPFKFSLFVCLVPMLMGFCFLPQGIRGHVFLENNTAMPSKGSAKQRGHPIATMVYIYEAANVNQLIGQEGNYAKGIKARLIKEVRSNNAGKFKLKLAPGKYSIVLSYQEGSYIPYFSGNNGLAFIEVLKHQYQEIDLSIIASSVN